VKTVSTTLGVARSNVVERRDRRRPQRGPQERPGDVELAGEIRRFVDERPTYGYRRIAALLKRERRSSGLPPVNTKRVYRLMKKHGLLLERHTGHRRAREHDGQVATIWSNCRWCSDTLEFACWNGEVVRVAFALDCHDRETISWVATTAGISGEMIRDMMVRCVEQRFGTLRAPYPVPWLSDNGSICAAHRTIEIALALNLRPMLHPGRKPGKQRYGRGYRENLQARLRSDQSDPECRRRTRSHRQLDGGLQHRASPLPSGLSLTPGVHPFPTRCVSGLIGSTPQRRRENASVSRSKNASRAQAFSGHAKLSFPV
jgi:putative transposase